MTNTEFSIQVLDGFVLVSLPSLGDFNAKKFEVDLLQAVNENPLPTLVNTEALTALPKDLVRILLLAQINIRLHDKPFVFVNVSSTLKKHIKEDGLDMSFKCYGSLKEALTDLKIGKKKRLDSEFVNPFLEGTLKVLQVQAQVDCVSGKISLKDAKTKYSADISGVIAIVSDSFTGSVIISFPAETFLGIMSNMLGETYMEVNQDILDGAGEITNMIFGHAKVVLNEKGYGIKMAIPSVISGKDHSHSGPSKGTSVIVPFTSSAGEFFVEICLKD